MKRALVVDTNFAAGPILGAAEKAGYEVFTVGSGHNGQLSVDSERHIELDYTDVASVQRIFSDMGFERLIPGCTDKSYEVCCWLAAHLDLPVFESRDQLSLLQNKDEFRRICATLKLPAPQRFVNQDEAIESGNKLIIKPVDAFSGRGISVVAAGDFDELGAAIRKANSVSLTDLSIVEEFIEGDLFSFSAFLKDQCVSECFHVAEFGTHNPFAVDVSYVLADSPLEEALIENIEALARHLGLDAGLMHVQYLANKDRYWLVEVTRRCPGDLYSEMITMATGFPYAEAFVSTFLEEKPPEKMAGKTQRYIRHTVNARQEGRLKDLHFHPSLSVERWYQLVRSGEMMPSGNSRIGVAFYQAQNQFQFSEALDVCLAGAAAGARFL